MNLTDVRNGLVTTVQTVINQLGAGWTVTDQPEPIADLIPPVAVVLWPAQIQYTRTMRLASLVVPIELYVSEADDTNGAETLGTLLSTFTSGSLIDALTSTPVAGAAWKSLIVTNAGEIGPRKVGPSTFTAATLFIALTA